VVASEQPESSEDYGPDQAVFVTAHQGVSAGEVVLAARWKFAGSIGAARLAEVGRGNPAEREPDLMVARPAG
jgi:hypothetical protein